MALCRSPFFCLLFFQGSDDGLGAAPGAVNRFIGCDELIAAFIRVPTGIPICVLLTLHGGYGTQCLSITARNRSR
jgi:hypothetical protein